MTDDVFSPVSEPEFQGIVTERIASIVRPRTKILHIGSDDGKLIEALLDSTPEATFCGIDDGDELCARATLRCGSHANSKFVSARIAHISLALRGCQRIFAPPYDIIIITFTLNKSSGWPQQQWLLEEALRMLSPAGLLLVADAFTVGVSAINELRSRFKLSPLTTANGSRPVDSNSFAKWANTFTRIRQCDNLANTYVMLSQVALPAIQYGGDVDIRTVAAALPQFGAYKYSPFFFYVLEPRL